MNDPLADRTLSRLYNRVVKWEEITMKDREKLLRALRELKMLRLRDTMTKLYKQSDIGYRNPDGSTL